MLYFLVLSILPIFSIDSSIAQPAEDVVAIVVHGGAGTISRSNLSPDLERKYRAALEEALRAGHQILLDGGTSIDAVTKAVTILEDSPLFNAGVGAVLTKLGTVEHDASIMDGSSLQAGASAATRHVRNPILLARLVMEASPHVLLVGEGAEQFGREHGLQMVENEHFITDRRREQLRRRQSTEADKGGRPLELEKSPSHHEDDEEDGRFGTVGAVALDRYGNLAAATSTGGTSNKHWGRVGDSPIIGAGTYADNKSCAVSGTGDGEYFIRGVVAYDICAKMRLTGTGLTEAASSVIHGKLTDMGGGGGVIAIDRLGNIAMPFNTKGMYRGYINTSGDLLVKIYSD